MNNFLVTIIVLLGITAVDAADMSGRWRFLMEPDFRGNRAVVECTLKQNKTALSVRCGNGVEMRGRVGGRTVTFRTPPATKSHLIAAYSAETNEDRTEFEGTWHLSGTAVDKRGKFKAEKHK